MASDSRGVWKPTSTWTGSNIGLNTAPPRILFLRSASSFSAICSQYELEARQLLGRSGDDDGAPAVADRQHRRQHGADVLRELLEKLGDALGVGVGDRHHRRAVTEHGDAAAAGHQRARGADQLRHRQQLHILGALGRERLDRQHALRVACDGDGRCCGQIHALAAQRAHSGDLGQQHAGHRHRGRRQVLGGGHRLLGRQRADPVHRLEPDRPHHDQLARDRLEQQLGFPDQRRQLGLDTGRGHQFLQGLQPGAALAAEGDGVGLACGQTIDKGVAGLRRSRFVVAAGGHPVMFIDRHVFVISSVLLLARLASYFVVCGLSSSRRCDPAPLRGHTRFVVESRLASDTSRGADGLTALWTVHRTLQPH